MDHRTSITALLAALVLMLCVAPTAGAASLTGDTLWSKTVTVNGVLEVEKGVTLTILPGTVVQFAPAEPDEEGLAQSGLTVRGTVVARGREGARILFTSAACEPHAGDWGEVKLFESEGSSFINCDFDSGGWGLHIHDSNLKIEACTFRDNSFGGIRGKGDGAEIAGCTITGMEVGIRFWQGAPVIRQNTITDNATGIFFRQGCVGAVVKDNNISGNRDYNLKLGDAHEEDVDVSGNWWGATDIAAIRNKIFDRDREEYIGRAKVEPVLGRAVVH